MFNTHSVSNWFWIIGDEKENVYSSAIKKSIPVNSKEFKSFLQDGNAPTHIKSIDELREVLIAQYRDGWEHTALDIKEKRRAQICAELLVIDMRSIRPAREGNAAKLGELEAFAQVLRDELRAL